jgi:hypothetical protein
MRRVIITNPDSVILELQHFKGAHGSVQSHGNGMYLIRFGKEFDHDRRYFHPHEFEFLDTYLLKYWLET